MATIKELAKASFPHLIDFRRDLHRHPEVSMQEFRTTDKICAELDSLGIPYRRLDPTGVIAEIKGDGTGKTVALRSDIDALSIKEQTSLPFSSENDGVMHACGHDVHTTVLLGAAMVLNQVKSQINGTVRLIFQPGEEVALGAKSVVDQGGIDNVDMIFGMHNVPDPGVGYICAGAGAVSAATDQYKVVIKGRTTHGAVPQAGVDATVVAAAIIMNLQTMVSREFDPMKPLVVTVGTCHSGSRWNIVSGEAVIEGTIRSADLDIHAAIPGVLERICKETAAAYRAQAEVEYHALTNVLINDEKATEIAMESAVKILGGKDKILKQSLQMGGEDHAEYANLIPSAYFQLGAGGEYPWHSEKYNPSEDSIPIGAALYAQTAIDMLNSIK